MLSGIIKITIEGVRKTKAAGEKICAVITTDKQNQKTPIHLLDAEGTSSDGPWTDTVSFDIVHKNAEVNISFWSPDDANFYGQYTFPPLVVKNSSNGETAGSFRLTKRKWKLVDKVDGEVVLKLQWIEKPVPVGIDDFLVLKVLGVGGFGKVVQVKKRDSGRIYAMKIIKKEYVVAKREVEHTMTERAVLGRVKHPFIISLKFSFQTKDRLFLILDFCNGGELFYHLQQNGSFPEVRSKFYAAEICLALTYLHENGIIYRDLKPENCLLDSDGHICLTDFGLAKAGLGVDIETSTSTFCGSIAYMAPEVLDANNPANASGYGRGVDWWSFGTIVFEMLSGMPPFYNRDHQVMVKAIRSKPLTFPTNFPRSAQDLIVKLLNRDPVKRLSNGAEIQKHQWFADVNFDDMMQKKVDPPFKPYIASPTDLKYFDPEFTEEMSPLMSYVDTKLSETMDEKYFGGFTYTGGENNFLSE